MDKICPLMTQPLMGKMEEVKGVEHTINTKVIYCEKENCAWYVKTIIPLGAFAPPQKGFEGCAIALLAVKP